MPGVLIRRENRDTQGEKPREDGGDVEELQCKPRMYIHKDVGTTRSWKGPWRQPGRQNCEGTLSVVRATQLVALCTAAQANGYRFASSLLPASFLTPSPVFRQVQFSFVQRNTSPGGPPLRPSKASQDLAVRSWHVLGSVGSDG